MDITIPTNFNRNIFQNELQYFVDIFVATNLNKIIFANKV
jgi:hypothetical protein